MAGAAAARGRGMSEADLLTMVRWLSPAFPVGSFAYSHGLEAAIASGDVTDGATAEAWVRQVISRGAGLSDGALMAAALVPGADAGALADLALALSAGRERRVETVEQGRAFAAAVTSATGTPHPPAPLPVAVGRAACGLDVAPERAVAFYLQAFATALVSAAVRFVPLGQGEGQRILTALAPDILSTAAAAVATPPDEVTACVPAADLSALAHETLDVRIYRT